jgi:hypothetical protein
MEGTVFVLLLFQEINRCDLHFSRRSEKARPSVLANLTHALYISVD